MNTFIHMPRHFNTNRILPGHGRAARRRTSAIPGVDRNERIDRRRGWTDAQARRRHAYGRGGHIGLVGALLALTMTVFAALGPNANVLDRPSDAPAVHLVDAAPSAPTATPRPS